MQPFGAVAKVHVDLPTRVPGKSPAWPGRDAISFSDTAIKEDSDSYLTQVAKAGAYAAEEPTHAQSPSSPKAQLPEADKVPIWLTLGFYEFNNIDMVKETYYTRCGERKEGPRARRRSRRRGVGQGAEGSRGISDCLFLCVWTSAADGSDGPSRCNASFPLRWAHRFP